MRAAGLLVLRVLGPVLAFAVGVITSLAVVALYQSWWWLGIAAVGTIAALLAPPDGAWLRIPFALGWGCVVVIALLGKPEGDFALGSNARGYAVLIGGIAVLIGAALASRTRAKVSEEV